MKKEIEEQLTNINLKGKKKRNSVFLYMFLPSLSVSIMCFIIFIFFTSFLLTSIYFTFVSWVLIFGVTITMASLSIVIYPFGNEEYCFKNFVEAIHILEKSSKEIAWEASYKKLRKAYNYLNKMELSKRVWYQETNKEINRFKKNLYSIVLPEVKSGSFNKDHLEEIALYILEKNSIGLSKANKLLEDNYKPHEPEPSLKDQIGKSIKEDRRATGAFCILMGYLFIFAACSIFSYLTGQDYMVFIKGNPAIIILGGVAVATLFYQVWKSKT